MRTIIAIDPGASGGIATLMDYSEKAWAVPMPDTEGDILHTIRAAFEGSIVQPVAFIEENTGYAGVKIPSHTMHKLGRNTGFILGVLAGLGIRTEMVGPKKWQATFGIGSKSGCASKTEWKNKLKAKAQQLYPHIKVTLSTADALLILDYARKQQV
jgi:hypothetical protein